MRAGFENLIWGNSDVLLQFTGSPKYLCQDPFGDVLPKRPYTFYENLVPFRPNYFFWFPHYRAKNKSCRKLYIWVSKPREKYKSNGKRIRSIRHTSEEKNPKNHPKIPYFMKMVLSDGFLDFSLHWYVGLSWGGSGFHKTQFFHRRTIGVVTILEKLN